jgi:hypothetical protein
MLLWLRSEHYVGMTLECTCLDERLSPGPTSYTMAINRTMRPVAFFVDLTKLCVDDDP